MDLFESPRTNRYTLTVLQLLETMMNVFLLSMPFASDTFVQDINWGWMNDRYAMPN